MTNKELQKLLAQLPDDARVYGSEEAEEEIGGLWMITKETDYNPEEDIPWKGISQIKNIDDVKYILISEDHE